MQRREDRKNLLFSKRIFSGVGLRGLQVLLFCGVVLYVLSYAIIPFSDGDPAYYAIVGRGLLRDHALPYQYTFDHKPLGAYLFYGVWDRIVPFYPGKFTLLAGFLIGVFVALGRTFGSFSRITAFALFSVCGALFDVLSGNTELVVVTGEAVCLAALLRGIETDASALFFLAGWVAAFTVSINYLAAVCLVGPVALMLLSPGWFRPSRCMLAGLGVLAGFGVLFAPYGFAGHGALQAYFSMQFEFLRHYGVAVSERIPGALRMVFYGVLMAPVLVAWVRRFPPGLRQEATRRTLILPVWFLSSFPATLLSGHAFDHYFTLCFAPVVLMLAILWKEGARPSTLSLMPLLGLSLVCVGLETKKNFNIARDMAHVDYAEVARLVGDAPVLNIRTYHAAFYRSDLKPFDVYLFSTHIDILFGDHAWMRYMQDLRQHPRFVIAPYAGCARHVVEAPVCQWLQGHYEQVYAVNVPHRHKSGPNKFSFSLYRFREQKDDEGS